MVNDLHYFLFGSAFIGLIAKIQFDILTFAMHYYFYTGTKQA